LAVSDSRGGAASHYWKVEGFVSGGRAHVFLSDERRRASVVSITEDGTVMALEAR
jgi:hypothetical protein